MKVLYDHQIFVEQKFGGISRYFNELMKYSDNSVEVVRLEPELFSFKKELIRNDVFSKGKRFLKRSLGINAISKTNNFHDPNNVILNTDFDIFHPTYYDPYFLDIINKPFVLTVHDMIHEIYKEYFPLSELVSYNKKLLCMRASKIITVSHKTKSDLMDIFDISDEKIHVVHLASDFDNNISVQPVSVNEMRNFILFVGGRDIYKNFYFFITAITEILKSDHSVQVLCTGRPFSVDEKIFFKELGIEKQLVHVYLNTDNELAWAYQNAKMLAFPSLYEGFGLPILEAFTSNCPVITSKGGSLPEVAGDAAIYFDPKSVKQIQEAVNTVLYNSTIRQDLIEKGKKRYSDFSWDKCRAETQAIYSSL